MPNLEDYDFIVGFTLFTPKGFKTMYRHFDKLETAKLFANNVNIKNNCKIYVDLDFHKDEMKNLVNENNDLHKEINRRIKLKIENEKIVDNEFISKNKVRKIIQKYYDEYEKEKEYRYTLDVEDEQRILRKIEKELLNERR